MSSDIPFLGRPRAFRMAGKSMYEDNAFSLVDRMKIIRIGNDLLKVRLMRFEQDRQPSFRNGTAPIFTLQLVHALQAEKISYGSLA